MQNQIINMCRVLIGPNAVVTDDQINDAIERVSLIFPNMDIAQVKRAHPINQGENSLIL